MKKVNKKNWNGKKKINQTVKTSGDSLWSDNGKKDVLISRIEWSSPEWDEDYGNYFDCLEKDYVPETTVLIYFNKKSWDTERDGLLYTDSGFIKNMRKVLVQMAKDGELPKELPWKKLSYSEQGMQHEDFTHCILGDW